MSQLPRGTVTFCGEFVLLWRGVRAEVWQSTEAGKPLEKLVMALDFEAKRPPGRGWRWQIYRPADLRVRQGYARTCLEARIAARNWVTGCEVESEEVSADEANRER
jgi:hypothetical protein